MNRPSVLGVVAASSAFGLVSCQDAAESEMVRPVDSAIVELRDGPTERELTAETQVIMLGTGTPIPDPHRAGPSIAVVHRGQAYLFDVGSGAIQNATLARYTYDIPSLYPTEICCVFITHLHSDHTLDYAELNFTMWWRRRVPVRAFGPVGLAEMTTGMLHMMQPDINMRESSDQPIMMPQGYRPVVTEIEDGIVLEQDGLTVEAFGVNHGDSKPAFGFRVTTAEKRVVISGDTAINDRLREMAAGVDILIHEVISDRGLLRNSEGFQAYHRRSHTTASDLGRLAHEARPALLVLHHGLFYGIPEREILDEVRATYDGDVVLADDLDRF